MATPSPHGYRLLISSSAILLLLPWFAHADLNCPASVFAPDCSLHDLEQSRSNFVIGNLRVGFENLPGLEVDHAKIRVSSFGEETGSPGILFEPTEDVWSVAAQQGFTDQIALGAFKFVGSEILGLNAFAYEFDVDVQGGASSQLTVLVEGTNQVLGDEYIVTAPAFDPAGGGTFPLQPNGAAIFLGISSGGGTEPGGSASVNSIRIFFDMPLVSAILPTSRSVEVGGAPATAFLTGINSGTETGTSCGVALGASLPVDFEFRTTDPVTNEVNGPANAPVDIAPGAAQSYVVSITPTASFPPTDVDLTFDCNDTPPASSVSGLNTLLVSASDSPVADVVALAATLDNDGIVKLASAGAFSVATVNVGGDDSITATADVGNTFLAPALQICQTDPASGLCLEDPVDGAFGVITQMPPDSTATYGVFVSSDEPIPFDPAVNRVFVRFTDPSGEIRGSTSVAVQTLP